jgi:hypothetical protein
MVALRCSQHLGFVVGENFHPLFGGKSVPAYLAFEQKPLHDFWLILATVIGMIEVFSVTSYNPPAREWFSIRPDHLPGDLGFDPLSLAPTDPQDFKTIQTMELNNGRLAMLAAYGMIAQEIVNGKRLFGG